LIYKQGADEYWIYLLDDDKFGWKEKIDPELGTTGEMIESVSFQPIVAREAENTIRKKKSFMILVMTNKRVLYLNYDLRKKFVLKLDSKTEN
jgi:hypothetical protein